MTAAAGPFTRTPFTRPLPAGEVPVATPTYFGVFFYGGPYGWSFPPPLAPVYLPAGYGFMGYGGSKPPVEPPWTPPPGGYGDLPVGRRLHVSAGVALSPIGGYAECTYTQTGQASPIVPTRAIPRHPPVVYVLDEDRKMIAALDGYELWEWTAHWRKPHECRLVMNVRLPGAEALIAEGYYLMAWTEAGILRMAEIETLTETGGEGMENEYITAQGRDYSRHLDGRVALSETLTTDGYDTWSKTSGSAAQAMNYFVWQNTKNIIPQGSTGWSMQNEFRVLKLLDLVPPPAVSATIDYAARFQYLTELLYEIGIVSELGYACTYNRATDRFEFRVIPGHTAQYPPVISLERGTAASIQAHRSIRDARTYAILAGQGEGAARVLNGTYDITYVSRRPGPIQYPNYEDRQELFVDARDCATSADIGERGNTRIAEFRPEESVEATLAPNGLLEYPRDIDLGDLVIVDHRPHAELAARIVTATERYTIDDGRTVEIVIGTEPADQTVKTAGFNRRRGSIYRV